MRTTKTSRAAAIAFAFAGLVASCAVGDRAAPQVGPEARAAATRISELRARYPLLGRPPALRVSRRAHVTLPVRASGEVKLEDETSGVSLRFALEHAEDVRSDLTDGIALFQGALAGADVLHRVHAEGTEDYVVFETRPAREELSYAVDVSRVPGLRLVSNTLEFLDGTGTPVLRVAPPYVVDARGERHEAKLAVRGCSYDTSPAAPWGRSVTAPAADRCNVHVVWGAIDYPAIVDPAWGATGSMATARAGHTASLLATGNVLVAGGSDGGTSYLASAELYRAGSNGVPGTFAATGAMTTGRDAHTATVLSSGKVLVVAGRSSTTTMLASAELYDPAGNGGAGTFAATGSVATARQAHTASLLATGKVLVAGGCDSAVCGTTFPASAEIFDPAGNAGSGAFVATGALTTGRAFHAASVLSSGKVLVAGGCNLFKCTSAISAPEVFDPAGNGGAGTFVATGPMVSPRFRHTSTALPSGKVLLAGGTNTTTLASAELFDPAGNGGAGTFVATGALAAGRRSHTATLLPSGKVLVVAGEGAAALASAELFDPAGVGTFAAAGFLASGRHSHRAIVLPSGKLVVMGGITATAPVPTAEVYGGALGEACTDSTFCLSNFCADGVCCNAACAAGGCDRCDLPGAVGTCGLAPAGNPGANAACASPFACDGVSATCPTSCASDAACAPAFFCATNGTCQARKAQAAACNPQADCKTGNCRECASGFCADGFCCDTACSGTCQACAAALKHSASADGICGPTKDGLDPRSECAPSGVLCGADGMCNGTGACRQSTPAGVACADGKVCDGAGTCDLPKAATCDGDHLARKSDGTTEDCAPYKCDATGACRKTCTSVSDCVAPTVCDPSGACAAPADGGDSGCSVVRVNANGGSTLGWLGVCAGLLLARRRRSVSASSRGRNPR